jgi:hypothetical protein
MHVAGNCGRIQLDVGLIPTVAGVALIVLGDKALGLQVQIGANLLPVARVFLPAGD